MTKKNKNLISSDENSILTLAKTGAPRETLWEYWWRMNGRDPRKEKSISEKFHSLNKSKYSDFVPIFYYMHPRTSVYEILYSIVTYKPVLSLFILLGLKEICLQKSLAEEKLDQEMTHQIFSKHANFLQSKYEK